MSAGSNESSRTPGPPEGASVAFRDLIEDRYDEWANEFGDEVHQRRSISFKGKPPQ